MCKKGERGEFSSLKSIAESGIVGQCIIQKSGDDYSCIYANDRILFFHGVKNDNSRESMQKLIDALPLDVFLKNRNFENNHQFQTHVYVSTDCHGHNIWLSSKAKVCKSGDDIYFYIATADTSMEVNSNLSFESSSLHFGGLGEAVERYFDIDVKRNIAEFAVQTGGNGVEKRLVGNYRESYLQNKFIFPEDVPVYLKNIAHYMETPSKGAFEFRAKYDTEDYVWYRCSYISIPDDKDRVERVIGKLINIETEKQYQALAERDTLTKLYNKGTFQTKASDYISSCSIDEYYALLVIDLDNFKMVNDKFGHTGGDRLLVNMAKTLSETFRSSDLISRIGGDEFAVLMKNNKGHGSSEMKAAAILDACNSIVGDLGLPFLSCSIGISAGVGRAISLVTLFNEADTALYEAKTHGKNRYVVFNPTTMDADAEMSGNHTKIARPDASVAEVDNLFSMMSQYVFTELCNSKNIPSTIKHIMGYIGNKLDVSRMYLFEDSEDGSYCDNTFEWCADGITSEIDNLQHLLYADLGDYYSNFNSDGIFYCPDISILPKGQREVLEPQGIKSVLQCTFTDAGEIFGYMGFDDCFSPRMWTKDQTEILAYTGRIMGVFLRKQRLSEKLAQLQAK